MQWSLDWRIHTIIAGRLGRRRYPRSLGRHIEHFVFLYTNKLLDIQEEETDNLWAVLPILLMGLAANLIAMFELAIVTATILKVHPRDCHPASRLPLEQKTEILLCQHHEL